MGEKKDTNWEGGLFWLGVLLGVIGGFIIDIGGVHTGWFILLVGVTCIVLSIMAMIKPSKNEP